MLKTTNRARQEQFYCIEDTRFSTRIATIKENNVVIEINRLFYVRESTEIS